MKKLLVWSVAACIALTGASVYAEPVTSLDSTKALTSDQKAQLETLYTQLFEKREEIINKYVEFGVLTREKGDKKIEQLKKYHSKLKENGYLPKHKKHMHDN